MLGKRPNSYSSGLNSLDSKFSVKISELGFKQSKPSGWFSLRDTKCFFESASHVSTQLFPPTFRYFTKLLKRLAEKNSWKIGNGHLKYEKYLFSVKICVAEDLMAVFEITFLPKDNMFIEIDRWAKCFSYSHELELG